MGRCKYDEFGADSLSPSIIEAITANICENLGIDESAYDWNVLKIRVKRANKAQRHRFADTICKLRQYISSNGADCLEFISEDGAVFYQSVLWCSKLVGTEVVSRWIDNGYTDIDTEHMHYYKYKRKKVIPHYTLSVAEFAALTGRNEKTVRDWIKRGFIYSGTIWEGRGVSIFVEETIKSIEKYRKTYYAK